MKTPWMSKGLKKSSKQKQRLNVKFLKKKTTEAEGTYKDNKHLFEKLKIKAKHQYYSKLLDKYKNDSKKNLECS